MFEKHRPNEKTKLQQDYFIFNITIASANLLQVGSSVTEIQKFGEDV